MKKEKAKNPKVDIKNLIAKHQAWRKKHNSYIKQESKKRYPELETNEAVKKWIQDEANAYFDPDHDIWWSVLPLKEELELLKRLKKERKDFDNQVSPKTIDELGVEMTIEPYKGNQITTKIEAVFEEDSGKECDVLVADALASFGFFNG